jgi:hypothetical protein
MAIARLVEWNFVQHIITGFDDVVFDAVYHQHVNIGIFPFPARGHRLTQRPFRPEIINIHPSIYLPIHTHTHIHIHKIPCQIHQELAPSTPAPTCRGIFPGIPLIVSCSANRRFCIRTSRMYSRCASWGLRSVLEAVASSSLRPNRRLTE